MEIPTALDRAQKDVRLRLSLSPFLSHGGRANIRSYVSSLQSHRERCEGAKRNDAPPAQTQIRSITGQQKSQHNKQQERVQILVD